MSSQSRVLSEPAPALCPDTSDPARAEPQLQTGGNSFAQWQLQSIGHAVHTLEDSVGQLYDARLDGANQALDMALQEVPPPWAEELLVSGATTAITAVAGYLGGPILASITASPALAHAERELAEGILESILSGQLEGSVSGKIRDGVSSEASRHSTRALFAGMKDGLGAEKVARRAAIRTEAVSEPEGALLAVAQGVLDAQSMARRVQMERSSVEFLNVLANADTQGQGGADLGRAGSGRSWWDMARGAVPRGIVHINVRYGPPEQRPQLVEAYLQGVPEEMLQTLVLSGLPVRELGLPVFVFGLLGDSSTLEIGRDETGELSVRASGTERWLEQAALARGHTSAEEGAAAVLDELASGTLAELGLA